MLGLTSNYVQLALLVVHRCRSYTAKAVSEVWWHHMQHYFVLGCAAEKQHINKVLPFGVPGATNYALPCS